MTWVAAAAAAAVVLTNLGWLRYASSLQRAHARREDLLCNQLMHLAGRTWRPPPTEPEPVTEIEERWLYDPERALEVE